MQRYAGWERLEPSIGRGGQSTVYLARSPERFSARAESFVILRDLSGQGLPQPSVAESFAKASWNVARPDTPDELGALKIFDVVRENGAPAAERLRREIAVLREERPGLPKLYAADESQQWMITEYFPAGSLEKHPAMFRGRAVSALEAFRGLVITLAALHHDGIVHRDIKPANVFVRYDGALIPGDFGIVYLPHLAGRPTALDERVGPRDYMPPWADLGTRVARVEPRDDVYMLGKLLWCMISGRAKLPREYFTRPQFDLGAMFPRDPNMRRVNSILEKCIVEAPGACFSSADDLFWLVDQTLRDIQQSVPASDHQGKPILHCSVCGKGVYREWSEQAKVQIFDVQNRREPPNVDFRILICNVCGHYAFFAPGYPDEAAGRGWIPPK